MENFPRETWSSTISAGYFVGYCFGDLVLGLIHYREYTDPVSGWIHHIVYACLVYRLAITKQLSFFLVCGAPLELSTVFLAGGHMFPHLRDDFWFPVSFFFSRIVFVTLMAHEMIFNVVTPPGGTTIYVLALFMHVYWLHLYLRGRKRRVQRRKKALEQEQQTQREAMLTNGHGQKVIISKTTTTTTIVSEGAVAAYSSSVARHSEGTFQLRIKNQQTQPTQ
ncbi:hypothetical protein BGW38_000489 [Lunasporangiospora selenospora]|uniref:TLC domain-containing protein n=1 Tax=Lunasporangiospora selenospora TaxID=979761 RepID=A0A9P6FV91_9FUNG|nr:hypothetical protein BGW38_000489 [Lunasporangiospora selenospora]